MVLVLVARSRFAEFGFPTVEFWLSLTAPTMS
jgi:hypothetical protein